MKESSDIGVAHLYARVKCATDFVINYSVALKYERSSNEPGFSKRSLVIAFSA